MLLLFGGLGQLLDLSHRFLLMWGGLRSVYLFIYWGSYAFLRA